jgi:hypothetical protein
LSPEKEAGSSIGPLLPEPQRFEEDKKLLAGNFEGLLLKSAAGMTGSTLARFARCVHE